MFLAAPKHENAHMVKIFRKSLIQRQTERLDSDILDDPMQYVNSISWSY